MIEFRHVVLGYGKKAILPPLSLTVCRGDFWGVVGPNGAGKTTLLKAILGLQKPLSGDIKITQRIRFGYVPQRGNLDEIFPLRVKDVVMMSRFSLGSLLLPPGKEDEKAVEKALKEVGLWNFAQSPYRNLSGGQKQRTLIARALAGEPDILILDEPTNGMDIKSESSIINLIWELNRKGITVILVTHLLNLVLNHAGEFLLLGERIFMGDKPSILKNGSLSSIYNSNISIIEYKPGKFMAEL